MNRWLYPCLLAIALVGPANADNAKPSPRAESLDLLVLGGEHPLRLELSVRIAGKPVAEIWDETFARLHSYLDRDGNGTLDATEVSRMPSAFALRQVAWGQVSPYSAEAPALSILDLDGDSNISGTELADYYRRAGLGSVLVGIGKAPHTDKLTNAILEHLDTDKNGKISEEECKTAVSALRKLDANDDELIGPGELVAKTAYPGAIGAMLLSAPRPKDRPSSIADFLPLVVLPIRLTDDYWPTTVNARLTRSKQPQIPPHDLLALRTSAPAATWQIRLDEGPTSFSSAASAGDKPATNARLSIEAGRTQIELRCETGKLTEQIQAARKRFFSLFADCDSDQNDTLDGKELSAPKAALFKQMNTIADRNADGSLCNKELNAWLDIQEQVSKGHALLTVLDYGNGLFELLDADHDGSLSHRELRRSWERLRQFGCITDGTFDRTKLPRMLASSISKGHPKANLGKPFRPGPGWFLAMDRNGDGDVSRREFTGSNAAFDKLDADHDGTIDSREASSFRK